MTAVTEVRLRNKGKERKYCINLLSYLTKENVLIRRPVTMDFLV